MKKNIAIARGDGVGPEVIDSAIEILDAIAGKFSHTFNYEEAPVGGAAYDKYGKPLPEKTLEICKRSDAILFGAVGGEKWDQLPGDKRPESAILGLRKHLNLFANIRPGMLFPSLKDASPLKAEIIKDGFDIVVVRELTGGIYFGEKGYKDTELGRAAYDIEIYSEMEVERIAKVAFDMAMKRKKKITSVDKANVLESSRLWRSTVNRVSEDYPEVRLDHMYVDNASMQVIKNPDSFDLILTSNLFGDILSDEISMLTGSIGMLPSASIGQGNKGIYEPIHGSAPDIAGKDLANPIASILSVSMMLKHSFVLIEESKLIDKIVNELLEEGYRTSDIAKEGEVAIGTREMTEIIKEKIKRY